MSRSDILRSAILDLVGKYYLSTQEEKELTTKINYAGRVYDQEELINLVSASLDFWLTHGRYCDEFEKNFSETVDTRYSLFVNSGSSANLLAFATLTSPLLENYIKRGDEIITVATCFPTTVSPIINFGAVPVFVDIDINTLNIDISKLEQAVSDKTKAVMVAHTLGNPFNVKEVKKFCNKYNLWLISDSCDALGAKFDGLDLSKYSDISTYSLYPAHQIFTGEGGMVCTNDPLLNKIATSIRGWGRECLTAGTAITTDKGIKSIENITVGEYVLGLSGNMKRVSHVFTNTSKELISIKPRNLKELKCTPNHEIMILRGGEYSWVRADGIKKNDLVVEALPKSVDQPENLRFNYITLVGKKSFSVVLEPDLFRLMGYWLAEGSLASGLKGKSGYSSSKYKSYRVDFAFNTDELELHSDVIYLMKKYFGVVGTFRRKGVSKGISLSFKTRKGFEFFKQLFGTGASNKKLPEIFVDYSVSGGIHQLIRGLWLGDGSFALGRGRCEQFSINSTSETLLNQVRRILLKYNITGSFTERSIDKHKPSMVGGKWIKAKHVLHGLSMYGENAEKFAILVGSSVSARKRYGNGVIFVDNYVCYPVVKLETTVLTKSVSVYNLEVEEDNSYHAEGFIVHNCQCSTGQDNKCGKRFSGQYGNLPFGYDHKYVYSHLGYNLEATEMQAAIGLAQLKKLPYFIKTRNINWNKLYNGLKDLSDYFIFLKSEAGAEPSYFGFPITLKNNLRFNRNDITTYLENNNIQTRNVFAGNILSQPCFSSLEENKDYRVIGKLPFSDKVCRDTFFVGVYPGLSDDSINYMISKIREFIT